jgi:hypothetical protein
MPTMEPKQPARNAHQRDRNAPTSKGPVLGRNINEALTTYLEGRRLVLVIIREVEGRRVEGFLKIEGGAGEHVMLDFKATSTPRGEISSLEVGGRRIAVGGGATATRRLHKT